MELPPGLVQLPLLLPQQQDPPLEAAGGLLVRRPAQAALQIPGPPAQQAGGAAVLAGKLQ